MLYEVAGNDKLSFPAIRKKYIYYTNLSFATPQCIPVPSESARPVKDLFNYCKVTKSISIGLVYFTLSTFPN